MAKKHDWLITNYIDPDCIIETTDGQMSGRDWLKRENARIGNCSIIEDKRGF